MVIHDKFISVHMVKTAGTFLQDYFGNNVPGTRGTGRGARRHHPASAVRDLNQFKFGTCRNPFSWYVSWWAFVGNQRRPGNSFPTLATKDFKETMNNLDNATGVVKQTSSHLFINFDILRRFDIGIMTWKFIETFCDHEKIFALDKWDGFGSGEILVDQFVSMENLAEDLIYLFSHRIFELSDKQKKNLRTMDKVNLSRHDHYTTYYDQSLIDWVKHRERYLFNMFGYNWGDHVGDSR